MSFSISPVSLYSKSNYNCSFKGARYASNTQSIFPAMGEPKPETVAKAEFIDGKLRVSTMLRNCIDSNIWYTIDESGRGFIQTAWCPGKDIKEGTYKELYKEAKELSDKNGGVISDDEALEIVDKIRNTDILG